MAEQASANVPNQNAWPPEYAWKGIVSPFNENSVLPSYAHLVKLHEDAVPIQDVRQVTLSLPILYQDDQDRQSALLVKHACNTLV